jgi:hypothetical protein
VATRFYLPSSGTAAASPAYATAWSRTADAARLPLVTVKGGTVGGDATINSGTAGTDWTNSSSGSLARQFVSAALAAQTISGTVSGQIRTRNSDLAGGCRVAIVVRVLSNDGATERAVLYSNMPASPGLSGASPDWIRSSTSTAATNRAIPAGAPGGTGTLTSYTCLAGDRLVVELGGTRETAVKPSRLRFGDDAGTDLPADTTSTTGDPWVEFSATLAFATTSVDLTLTPTGVSVTAAATSLEPAVSLTIVPDGVSVTSAAGLTGFLATDEHFPNPTPTAQGRYLALPRMSPTPSSFAQTAVVFNQAAVKLESAVNEPPQRTLRVVSETLAVSTTGTTTDTSKYLLRPDAVIDHVRVLITDAITGAGVTTMSVGDGTTAARFLASASDLTLGAGYVGLAHVDAGLTVQATAAPLRLTFDATPTGGVVRLEVWYTQFLVPSLS